MTDETPDGRSATQRAGVSFHRGVEDRVLGRPAPDGADESYLRGAEYARDAERALPAADEDLPPLRASHEVHARRAASATDEQLRRVVRLHRPECECAYHAEIARRVGSPFEKLPADAETAESSAHAAAMWDVVLRDEPLDRHLDSTLTVEEWLSRARHAGDRADRWRLLMSAIAAVWPRLDERGGPRDEPRVGHDLARDQVAFVFKCRERGATIVLSPSEASP